MIPVLVAVLIMGNVLLVSSLSNTVKSLEQEQSMVVKTKSELNQTKSDKATVEKSLKEHQEKVQILNKENKSLKAKLQAKKVAESKKVNTLPIIAKTTKISGNKQSWLAQSGIPKNLWGYVDYLVTKESGWNPGAVNKSSGACGLGQQLPCGKWSGAWNDPVASLRGMHGYVMARYGSWQNAVAHSKSVGWY